MIARRLTRHLVAAAAWLMLLGSVAPVVDAWQHALERSSVDAHCIICHAARAAAPAPSARELPLPHAQYAELAAPHADRAVASRIDRTPPRSRGPPA